MDFISTPMLLEIKDKVGEIGSELFGKLFLNSPDSKQVRAFLLSLTSPCNDLKINLLTDLKK
jgi:hypothetical protein